MGTYEEFTNWIRGQSSDNPNAQILTTPNRVQVSIDSNQAGSTMTSRHEVSKQLLQIALIPGFGKIGFTVGKAAFGMTKPKNVLKVIWPLLLFDDPPSLMMKWMEAKLEQQGKSPRQDMTSVIKTGQIPKTRGGTKSSRAAKSAPSTVKPFWSNGKPKCRKGYRYDFKRKMCVKKS
jgi:hypothetical protein